MSVSNQTDYKRIGYLAEKYCRVTLPLQVLRSGGGYYLGTQGGAAGVDRDDFSPEAPVSRESEYFGTEEEAKTALRTGRWTQRMTP